ncbi:MAG: glycosyltransferase, partial [Fulvivirga sp.]|uniref:glycosyltransferase n=1 Tax=Fulvivirga sp. TaxID=1931237 RepID=UPI0032EB924B
MKFKILFLHPYPTDQAPSQRFRFEQYYPIIKESKNLEFESFSFFSHQSWKKLYSMNVLQLTWITFIGFLKRFIHLYHSVGAHFVFIHRELTPIGPPIFEWILAKVFRKRIIYDFDDAIWLEDPVEKGTIKSKIKWKSKVAKICHWSWKVNVGNQFLADFAKLYNNNVSLIPSVVNTTCVHNPDLFSKPPSKTVTIGWTGTHSTLQYLHLILPTLQKLEKKNNIKILIIANREPFLPLRTIEFKSWKKETEIKDMLDLDIGIMPLTNDEWSKGKGGFKLVQYLSLGIPAVCSPVGINRVLIKNGETGYTCETTDQWLKALNYLIENEDERKKMGVKG